MNVYCLVGEILKENGKYIRVKAVINLIGIQIFNIFYILVPYSWSVLYNGQKELIEYNLIITV